MCIVIAILSFGLGAIFLDYLWFKKIQRLGMIDSEATYLELVKKSFTRFFKYITKGSRDDTN